MQSTGEQTLYRFMDFYELYELLVHNKLKFTKLRLMEDKNEGLGEVLKLQSGSWGFPLRNNREYLQEAYDFQRESVYISCWTPIADAMAMWLLYSKHHAGIRIKTSETKLRAVLKANERELYGNHHKLPAGALVPFIHELGPVGYVDFRQVHELSKLKLEAYDLQLKEAHLKGEAGKEEFEALIEERNAGQIDELKHPGQLKDEAYKHENEVRASFHLRVRNEMTLDELRALPNTIYNTLGNPMLDVPTRDNSPSVVHLTTSSNFVEEICFDSRMPRYHQKSIKQILERGDLPYTTTSAFGCLMDERDLTIKEL